MKTLKLLILSSILTISSCATDPCLDVTCLNDGVCDDGTCICADWYEGADCGIEERAKYYGNYTGALNFYNPDGSPNSSSQTTIPVTAGSVINELDGDGLPFVLNTSGTSDFTIPITQISDPDFGSVFWQGSGSFSGNLVSLNGSFDVQGQTFTFSFSGNK